MPCFRPLDGYRARSLTKNGKRGVVFNVKYGYADMPVKVPCGQCIGCRLERSRQWAVRCMHEASLHDENIFITLTYDNDHLPSDHGLYKPHYQKFIRSLRKKNPGKRIRYYQCGEYGGETLRPHYHALLFNHDFDDKQPWSKTKNGDILYVSRELDDIWGHGQCWIGDVTFKSAGYVARYIMKKVNGDDAENHYKRADPETGEEWSVLPEYTTMSRRPGIGAEWFEKYSKDAYPSDFLIADGKKVKPPKYYDEQYDEIEQIKRRRKAKAKKHAQNNTRERLDVRERVTQRSLDKLKREFE